MPKAILQSDLDTLLYAVKLFPYGASFDEIFGALDKMPARRTLQRHLALLVKMGTLEAEGRTRSRRYRIGAVRMYRADDTSAYVAKEKAEESAIPLSSVAQSVQAQIRRPIAARRPVSYNREFLEKYRPNETYYLPAPMRKHLLELGKSPDGKRAAGTYARQIFNRLLIDLSWNSSRLEGNTYSLLDTERLLALGELSDGKNMKEAQMILNHKAAIEFLVESAEYLGFNNYTILNLHALLSNNLLSDPRASGSLRTLAVGIGGTVYEPLAVPQLISDFFGQILHRASLIKDPFEQAFFSMVHLPYLQPFEDVNKRVSRLAANIPLIRENLSPLSFVDVPERIYIDGILAVYELNRVELLRDLFVWAYERSCLLYSRARQTLGEPDPFRMRYRDLILETITEVVRECMDKKRAASMIKKRATSLPKEERARFIEVAEVESMGLHEGNIARYRVRPSEYEAWKKGWR